MQAINEKLKWISLATPGPGPKEVLIQVKASGVNWADIDQKKGNYPPPPGASNILGLEVAGIVAACGKEVTSFKKRDRVMALLPGGGYAEYATVHEGCCFKMPPSLSFVEGAALPESLFTVWNSVFRLGQLKKGESLLVHGGTGSVGSIAVQLASQLGFLVYATAGTDEKCKLSESLGAKKAIHYKKEDFEKVVQNVDVILDSIGVPYFHKNIRALKKEGRLVLIDSQEDIVSHVDLGMMIGKSLIVIGSVLRPLSMTQKIAIGRELKKRVLPLLKQKVIAPLIAQTFSWKEVQKAHDYLEKRKNIGKVVLTID